MSILKILEHPAYSRRLEFYMNSNNIYRIKKAARLGKESRTQIRSVMTAYKEITNDPREVDDIIIEFYPIIHK